MAQVWDTRLRFLSIATCTLVYAFQLIRRIELCNEIRSLKTAPKMLEVISIQTKLICFYLRLQYDLCCLNGICSTTAKSRIRILLFFRCFKWVRCCRLVRNAVRGWTFNNSICFIRLDIPWVVIFCLNSINICVRHTVKFDTTRTLHQSCTMHYLLMLYEFFIMMIIEILKFCDGN